MALLGFPVAKLKPLLVSLTDGHVVYSLGAKVWVPRSVAPEKVSKLDCSGFTKYVVDRVATPYVGLAAGSWHQEKWCKKNLTKADYGKEASRMDGVVRIAFRDKTKDEIRHVWFVINGWTVECTTKGGRNGPTSLRWNLRKDEADDFFQLGKLDPPTFDAFWMATATGTAKSK